MAEPDAPGSSLKRISDQSISARSTERRSTALVAIIAFAILTFASFGLLLLSSLLGQVDSTIISDPTRWLRELSPDASADILATTTELLAGILAVAITVAAIVVELAATRYSHRITKHFIAEPVNIAVMSLFLLTTILSVWLAATLGDSAGDALVPNAGIGITLILETLSLLVLLPYFYFVFSFISPLSIIQKLQTDAQRNFTRVTARSARRLQVSLLEAVDELQDIARSAADQGDTRISMAAVDALTDVMIEYMKVSKDLPEEWFVIDASIAHDPDFVSLGPSALEEMRREKLWFEVKVIRQYFALVNQTVPESRDIANLIAINTERVGIAASKTNPALLALIVRSFNTYMRTTIRAGDPRTAYYVMNQYRSLAEELLDQRAFDTVAEIVEHFRYYATFSHSLGESFLLEVAAYDIVTLIEKAVQNEAPIVDSLLDQFLKLDQEIRSDSQEASLLGVRRAQIQLATFFLSRDDQVRARRIVTDLLDEKFERLEGLRQALLTENRPQYWEFTDRGVNFSYLAPEYRPHLHTLFAWLRDSATPPVVST
jgi:hypothetical protein